MKTSLRTELFHWLAADHISCVPQVTADSTPSEFTVYLYDFI